jgi:crossover junction endodeoxyribonuclease RuvC
MPAVRVLGIDPGTVLFGFACLELGERVAAPSRAARPLAHRAGNVVSLAHAGGACAVVDAGAIKLGRGRCIAERLCALAAHLDELLRRLCPDELALEEAFCGRSVQSALRIGEARGVVLARSHAAGVVIHQYPPARIKRAVAGSGAADKAAVAAMAMRQLGLESLPGPPDVGDALAAALCRVEERRARGVGFDACK